MNPHPAAATYVQDGDKPMDWKSGAGWHRKVPNTRYIPAWLKRARTKDAVVTINDWGQVTWKCGTWINGDWRGFWWESGVWESGYWYEGWWINGEWRLGTWYGGVWCDGVWCDGVWEKGDWKNGHWHRGVWRAGKWCNGHWHDGRWKSGIFAGGWWYAGEFRSGVFYEVNNPDLYTYFNSERCYHVTVALGYGENHNQPTDIAIVSGCRVFRSLESAEKHWGKDPGRYPNTLRKLRAFIRVA